METSKSISVQKENGEILFSGTDVAIAIFFNYLKAGKSTEIFLDDYPSVTIEQLMEVLEMAENALTQVIKM